MTPQRRKRIIIGTAILVICGVVGYFIYKKIKDSKPEEQPPAPAPDSSSGSSNTGSGSNVGSGNQYTFPFKTTDEGNKFRAWVIAKDPEFAKSIKLDPTGQLNSFVQKAWDKYGAEYQKGTTPTAPTTPTTTSALLDELAKNLGTGTIPVERYVDKVIARQNLGGGINITGYFFVTMVANKPMLMYVVAKTNQPQKKGTWSNGGKTIVMSNGRIITSNNVWENIKTSANA